MAGEILCASQEDGMPVPVATCTVTTNLQYQTHNLSMNQYQCQPDQVSGTVGYKYEHTNVQPKIDSQSRRLKIHMSMYLTHLVTGTAIEAHKQPHGLDHWTDILLPSISAGVGNFSCSIVFFLPIIPNRTPIFFLKSFPYFILLHQKKEWQYRHLFCI